MGRVRGKAAGMPQLLFYSRLNEVVTQKQSLKIWEHIHFILWTKEKDDSQYNMLFHTARTCIGVLLLSAHCGGIEVIHG